MTYLEAVPNPEEPSSDVVRIDVDGDGIPDVIQPGPGQAEPGTDVVVRPVPQLPVRMLEGNRDLRPVLPPWLLHRPARRAVWDWWWARQWHKAQGHAARLPSYVWGATWRAPRGAWWGMKRLSGWLTDYRADPMEQDLASSGKQFVGEYLLLRKDRSRRIRARWVTFVAGIVASCGALIAGAVLLHHLGRPWSTLGTTLAVTAGWGALVRLGTNPENPVVQPLVITSHRLRELTPAILKRALKHAGLGGSASKVDKEGRLVEEGNEVGIAGLIARSASGTGTEVLVDLPWGKTVSDALEVLPRIASGLDTHRSQVVIEPVRGAERRMVLFVADEDPFERQARPSPLIAMPQTSIWRPNPLGVTIRGIEVRPELIFNSVLIGARPRRGKTFGARVLVAPAILDPLTDILVLDFKGGRDWKAAGDVATAYVSGDDMPQLEVGLALLEEERRQAREIFAQFRKMSDKECPEAKITPEMAERYGIRPKVIVADEIQNLLRASDKDMRAASLDCIVWLAKTAPAAGRTLVAGTQRPAAEVVPEDLRANVGIRIAYATVTFTASEAVLGQGTNKLGWSSHVFLDHHKGRAIVRGVQMPNGGDFCDIRTDHMTSDDFARICAVGRQRRIDAGTLRGEAVGEQSDIRITVRIVDDVARVWPGHEEKAHGEEILARLRRLNPELYGPMDQAAVTKALGKCGVPVGQVWAGGRNANGYERTAVQAATRKRLEARGPDDET